MAELLKVLADKLHYKFEFVQPPDGRWGHIMSNGSWSGMIGMVARKEVHFAVGPFFATWAREQVSDISAPLLMDSQSVMMQRPGLYSDVFGFLKPFTDFVYFAIFLSLIAIAATFRVVVSLEEKIYKENPKVFNFSNSLFWATRTLAQEASYWYPDTNGSKIVMATWLLGTFIFMKAYEGILTAMITVPKVEIPIDSLKDLVNQDEVSWKLEAAAMMYQYFEESTTEIGRKVFNNKNGTFSDCFTSCDEIGKGAFVGICDFTTIKKCMHWSFSKYSECTVYAAKTPALAGIMLSMAFQSNSTLTSEANNWIGRVHQGGLFDKWLRDEMVNASQCFAPPSSDTRSSQSVVLKLENFSGSFFLLVLGYTAGILAFILELLWHAWQTRF